MTKSQEKYYKIVCPSNKEEASDGQGNNILMQRDDALITIFSYISTNMLEGPGRNKFGSSRSWMARTTSCLDNYCMKEVYSLFFILQINYRYDKQTQKAYHKDFISLYIRHKSRYC